MISIIVPVYKAEAYLPVCIKSILHQTYRDFELILVDDGSPDKSGKICEDFATRDKRITVIHQPNGGVSNARNAGIKVAKGDWLCFVDADDIILPRYLESFIKKLTSNLDLIVQGWLFFHQEGDKLHCKKDPRSPSSTFVDSPARLVTPPLLFHSSLRSKLFKRSIILDNNIQFPEYLQSGEDAIFYFHYLIYAEKIMVSRSFRYLYRKDTPNSASKKLQDPFRSLYLVKQRTKYIQLLCHRYHITNPFPWREVILDCRSFLFHAYDFKYDYSKFFRLTHGMKFFIYSLEKSQEKKSLNALISAFLICRLPVCVLFILYNVIYRIRRIYK